MFNSMSKDERLSMEEYCGIVHKHFNDILKLLDIEPNKQVIEDLSLIVSIVISRMKNLPYKKNSSNISKEAEKIKEELLEKGGKFEDILSNFSSEIKKRFGIFFNNPLKYFMCPKLIYKENGIIPSVKRFCADELIKFYLKYRGDLPKLKQDWIEFCDGGSFQDFYIAVEKFIEDNIKLKLSREPSTEYDLLKKRIKIFKTSLTASA